MVKANTPENFWTKVDIRKPDECWNWLGTKNPHGYGKLRFRSRNKYLAHRLSWSLANGEIPDGMNILHKCDNPSCVNPNHLYPGTQSQNLKDAYSRGRYSQKGEHGNGRKLTLAQVLEIRRLYSLGGYTYPELGKMFNTCTTNIGGIVRYDHWVDDGGNNDQER